MVKVLALEFKKVSVDLVQPRSSLVATANGRRECNLSAQLRAEIFHVLLFCQHVQWQHSQISSSRNLISTN